MLNNILIVVSLLGLVVMLFVMYQRSKSQQEFVEEADYDTIDKVVEAVKLEMVEIIKDDYSLGLTESEFNALYPQKAGPNHLHFHAAGGGRCGFFFRLRDPDFGRPGPCGTGSGPMQPPWGKGRPVSGLSGQSTGRKSEQAAGNPRRAASLRGLAGALCRRPGGV